MEKIKCSFNEHSKIDAIKLCSDCNIYICNKCEKLHSGFFINHHLHNVDNNINDIFTGFCKEEKHFDKLEYFCKTHNILCCSACIVKLKNKGKGLHSECDVCFIEDIKNEKKNILKKSIQELEILSGSLQDSINKLKKIFEEINKDKEELKINIQKIFTEIRNTLNNREDELLLKVEEEFDKLFVSEKKVKDFEKLPNKIKISLDRGKSTDNDWNDDNKLSSLINNCLQIENDLKYIKLIYTNNITAPSKIKFNLETKEINKFLDTIKNFGDIVYEYKGFLNSPIILNNALDYNLSGENKDIITKIGKDGYRGTLILDKLDKNKEYTWKIKLLKSRDNFHYYIGVASSDFDIRKDYKHCGWYLYVWSSTLWSGPPHNYNAKQIFKNSLTNEIIIIMNMKERTLKFKTDKEDPDDFYKDIPTDKPLYPAIFMYYTHDSLQFIKCEEK